MKLRERIGVEQLDEERLTNIERKLVVRVSEMSAPPARASRRLLARTSALTSAPASSSARTMCAPISPLAPVTSAFMRPGCAA